MRRKLRIRVTSAAQPAGSQGLPSRGRWRRESISEPLLKRSGLTKQQAKTPAARVAVSNQIKFLNLVADALQDDFLGIRLAQNFDLRELGLLYYVQASSATLSEALQRVARYSSIMNEGVRLTYCKRKDISMTFEYRGVSIG